MQTDVLSNALILLVTYLPTLYLVAWLGILLLKRPSKG